MAQELPKSLKKYKAFAEIKSVASENLEMECLRVFQTVNESWNALDAPSDKLYTWNPKSTYIKSPPFFDGLVSVHSPFESGQMLQQP